MPNPEPPGMDSRRFLQTTLGAKHYPQFATSEPTSSQTSDFTRRAPPSASCSPKPCEAGCRTRSPHGGTCGVFANAGEPDAQPQFATSEPTPGTSFLSAKRSRKKRKVGFEQANREKTQGAEVIRPTRHAWHPLKGAIQRTILIILGFCSSSRCSSNPPSPLRLLPGVLTMSGDRRKTSLSRDSGADGSHTHKLYATRPIKINS